MGAVFGSYVWRGWVIAELLLLKSDAHARLGDQATAIATVDRLLHAWKHADPDLRVRETEPGAARSGPLSRTWARSGL
jgi:hypothetical protein